MADLPAVAAWRHVGARDGFEVLFIARDSEGYRLEGHTTGVEEGVLWGIRYLVVLDRRWRTRRAHVVGQSQAGSREVRLEVDGDRWIVDGQRAPSLDGCADVDLEASACTNALPVNRLGLDVGQRAQAPAAWVRVDLSVERLEQSYARTEDADERAHYDYAAPGHDFTAKLVYDENGLVIDYSGLATRFV
jgi:hypothetical protein